MADANAQPMADFTCSNGPLDTVAEAAPTDEIGPVLAPAARPASPRSAAELKTRPGRDEQRTTEGDGELVVNSSRRVDGTLPRTKEERLHAEVTRLRTEAAASPGLLEEREHQTHTRANSGLGRDTGEVSWIEAGRNELSSVYKEATFNSEVGVDQSLETYVEDVSDRFRHRIPEDVNQFQRRRARSTPAIMQELRYGIFSGVNRFKECYLTVLRLKMTSHPTREQLIGAAKAKFYGLKPLDGLNPSVSDTPTCPPLINWRTLKDIDRFGGRVTNVDLTGTRSHIIPETPGASQAEVSDLDPLSPGDNEDGADAYISTDCNDDGDGSAPLSSSFSLGRQNVFQGRRTGRKTFEAAKIAEFHFAREVAANTAALESLAESAAQRTACVVLSTPTAVNSECGRRWCALEMRQRLLPDKDKDKDEKRCKKNGGDFQVSAEGPARRGRGGLVLGVGRRRGRAELQGYPHGKEEEYVQATNSRGAGACGRASCIVRGRGRGRCVAPGRNQLSKRTRTVRFADVTSSVFSSSLSLHASPPPPT